MCISVFTLSMSHFSPEIKKIKSTLCLRLQPIQFLSASEFPYEESLMWRLHDTTRHLKDGQSAHEYLSVTFGRTLATSFPPPGWRLLRFVDHTLQCTDIHMKRYTQTLLRLRRHRVCRKCRSHLNISTARSLRRKHERCFISIGFHRSLTLSSTELFECVSECLWSTALVIMLALISCNSNCWINFVPLA